MSEDSDVKKVAEWINTNFEEYSELRKLTGQSVQHLLLFMILRNLDQLNKLIIVQIEQEQRKKDGIITPGEFNPEAYSLK